MDLTRIFLDMDDVLADYLGACEAHNVPRDEAWDVDGWFRDLPLLGNAKYHVHALERLLPESIYFLSTPPFSRPGAYAEKAEWITKHFPAFTKRLILSNHKGLVGGEGDVLVDDRPTHNGVDEFRGTVIHFNPERSEASWVKVYHHLGLMPPGRS